MLNGPSPHSCPAGSFGPQCASTSPQICDPTVPIDVPTITKCQFCSLADSTGCAAGTCLLNPIAGIPLCSCPTNPRTVIPPTCSAPYIPGRVCSKTNRLDNPSITGCVFCNLTDNAGCSSGGTCAIHPLAKIPLCQCPAGKIPPTCDENFVANRVCDPRNPLDVPPIRGCVFCDVNTNAGCVNGGTCALHPLAKMPLCQCPANKIPPTCAKDYVEGRVCDPSNPLDVPPITRCTFCDPVNDVGCFQLGKCRTILPPLVPAPLNICSCPPGLAPPLCATASPNRLCDPANPFDAPFVTGCDWCTLGTNAGCTNGGNCYPRNFGPVVGNLSICNCGYTRDPPQCQFPSKRLRLCVPGVATDVGPPVCEFCYPNATNGCSSQGKCSVQNYTSTDPARPTPPLFQLALCTCFTGRVAPDCTRSTLAYFGQSSQAWMFYLFAGLFGIPLALSIVFGIHLIIKAKNDGQFQAYERCRLATFIAVFCSCALEISFWIYNPDGQLRAYTSRMDVITNYLLVNLGLALLAIGFAFFFGDFLATRILSNHHDGWPALSKVVVIGAIVFMLAGAGGVTWYQLSNTLAYKLFLIAVCAFILAVLLVALVAYIIVSARTSRRASLEIILILVGCIILTALMLGVGLLPSSTFTNSYTLYLWLVLIVPVICLVLLLSLLVLVMRYRAGGGSSIDGETEMTLSKPLLSGNDGY